MLSEAKHLRYGAVQKVVERFVEDLTALWSDKPLHAGAGLPIRPTGGGMINHYVLLDRPERMKAD
jgi:hypothetical protein